LLQEIYIFIEKQQSKIIIYNEFLSTTKASFVYRTYFLQEKKNFRLFPAAADIFTKEIMLIGVGI
jgi:hypothetical protein